MRMDSSITYSESGTGLGLYIADRLTAVMGGSLELSNIPDGGLKAEIRLPIN